MQTSDASRNGTRAGLTFVELLVVLGIVLVLMAIAIPAVMRSQANVRSLQCQSRQRQLALSILKSQANLGDRLTARDLMARLDYDLESTPEVWRCPENHAAPPSTSFGFNGRLHRLGAAGDARKILGLDYRRPVADVVGRLARLDWQADVAARHIGFVNVVFYDAHVSSWDPEELDPHDCEVYETQWRPTLDVTMAHPDVVAGDCVATNDSIAFAPGDPDTESAEDDLAADDSEPAVTDEDDDETPSEPPDDEPQDDSTSPKGLLFVLQAVDHANVTDQQLAAVDGLSIRVTWSALETAPGKFDWQFLDQQVARCKSGNQQFQLRLMGGEAMPAWYFNDREAVAFQSKTSGDARMPVPWSDDLHNRLAIVYAALGARYGSNPLLHTVHISGVSRRSAEMHQPPELAAYQGYSSANMTAAWSKLAATIKTHFPGTYISLNLTNLPYTGDVVAKCKEILKDKAVFQHNALKASTNPFAPHHQWIVKLAKEGRHTAFQMVGPSINQARFGGTIEQAYALGDKADPLFYEIYRSDVPKQ